MVVATKRPLTPDTKTYPIIEIFGPTVQGEGRMTGVPVYFVRTGGCDYRCSWCDSMYAVDPAEVREHAIKMTAQQIIEHMEGLPGNPEWVVISGGNPALHNLETLVQKIHRQSLKVAVETQGTVFKPWLLDVDLLTLSPKPPSSGMDPERKLGNLARYISGRHVGRRETDLKIVAFDEEDLGYAKTVFRRFPANDHLRHFLSLGTLVGESTRDDLLDRYRELVERATRDPALCRVTLGVQLHVLTWGHGRGF